MTKIQLLSAIIFIGLFQPVAYPMETVQTQLVNTVIQPSFIPTCLYSLVIMGQLCSFWWLKKNNYLFGEKVIPKYENTNYLSPGLFIFLPLLAHFITSQSDSYPNNLSSYTKSLGMLSGALSILLIINFSHQECLKDQLPTLQLNTISNQQLLSESICPICRNDFENYAVYPCANPEHLYCRECLFEWCKRTLKEGLELRCLLCLQKVNVIIKKPSVKNLALKFVTTTDAEMAEIIFFLTIFSLYTPYSMIMNILCLSGGLLPHLFRRVLHPHI